MADVPAYFEKLVEAVGRASHDYFKARGQTRLEWAELPPIYRHTARESHSEILRDGPLALIEREIGSARAEAPVLRLRIEMLIADLRERSGSTIDEHLADELEAAINTPLED